MATSPVLSPMRSIDSPSRRASVSSTFAIGVLGTPHVPVPANPSVRAAGDEERQTAMIVDVRVAHRAAVQHDGTIEQVPVAVRGGA